MRPAATNRTVIDRKYIQVTWSIPAGNGSNMAAGRGSRHGVVTRSQPGLTMVSMRVDKLPVFVTSLLLTANTRTTHDRSYDVISGLSSH